MATIQDKIAGLYAAFFNRAPDKAGFDMWSEMIENGDKTLTDIAIGFTEHDTYAELYDGKTDEEFVNAIYQNMTGTNADAKGLTDWIEYLQDHSRAEMIASYVEGVLDLDMTDRDAWADLSDQEYDDAVIRQNLIKNKVEASLAFIDTLGEATNVEDPANPENDPAYIASDDS